MGRASLFCLKEASSIYSSILVVRTETGGFKSHKIPFENGSCMLWSEAAAKTEHNWFRITFLTPEKTTFLLYILAC